MWSYSIKNTYFSNGDFKELMRTILTVTVLDLLLFTKRIDFSPQMGYR